MALCVKIIHQCDDRHNPSHSDTEACYWFVHLHVRLKPLCLWCTLCVSYQDQSGEQAEDFETEEQLQARILTTALEFVPEHGWTVEAIAAGAEVWRIADVMMRLV